MRHPSAMDEKASTNPPDRLRVLAVVLASFLAGFIPLLLLGSGGIFWIKILLIGSLPIISFAALVTVVFARSVARHPYRWSAIAGFSAVALSVLWMWMETHTFLGMVSLIIVAPAVGVFMAIARWRPALLCGRGLAMSAISGFAPKS
jgi:hypothetical protein